MIDEWEEVKRLASDLQRAQSASSSQRLSERNCVEVVSKLVEMKLLEVYFTNDARQYVTPAQLAREIQDELYLHGVEEMLSTVDEDIGIMPPNDMQIQKYKLENYLENGHVLLSNEQIISVEEKRRLGVAELSTLLNVDYNRIEECSESLARQGKFQISMGELLSCEYMDGVAENLNEKLQQEGFINLARLTKALDIPTEFLRKEMEKRAKNVLIGRQDETDSNLFVTDAYLSRNRAKIRGALSGVTKPTRCAQIISHHELSEHMFQAFSEELLRTGRIAGVISGGKNISSSVFIPEIHSHAQSQWVSQYFRQNGFVDYEAVSRLGITDPKAFIRRILPDEEGLEFLSKACVGKTMTSQVQASLQDELSTCDWVDAEPFLPSNLAQEEIGELIELVLKRWETRGVKLPKVIGKSLLVSETLSTKVLQLLDPIVDNKAKEDVAKGTFKINLKAPKAKPVTKKPSKRDSDDEDDGGGRGSKKKEERRKKAAGGKAGGGAQGRETKTKSTKKKYMAGKDAQDFDEHSSEEESLDPRAMVDTGAEFMPLKDLSDVVKNLDVLRDAPPSLGDKLAAELRKILNTKYNELAKTYALASTPDSASDIKTKFLAALRTSAGDALANIRLYAKGSDFVTETDSELGAQLKKHLCRTLVSQLAHKSVLYLAWTSEDGENLEVDAQDIDKTEFWENFPTEVKARLMQSLPNEMKAEVTKMMKNLSGDDLEVSLKDLETLLGPGYCEILFKKPDKKRDKSLHHDRNHLWRRRQEEPRLGTLILALDSATAPDFTIVCYV
ncbi:unnamed protein product [Notodromas monacha]|uniref:E3 UFM1-protein ligase 1 homolog n=1 Tax=Notodromas monacha TaxID=399045 RepID=A0A7R9BU53_9CRUS|nr:unnamed protein product [Notodromas monacha]CAG0920175.1 unnamed protein product [Notodromas monacha]